MFGSGSGIVTAIQRGLLAATALEEQLYPRPVLPVRFRTLAQSDCESCVRIYRQNASGRFPPSDLEQFEGSLRKRAGNCIVAELDSRVVGFGGVSLMAPKVAVLFYGMIALEHQRKRIGAALTHLRLAQLPEQADGYYVFIFAVEASIRVYSRFGFSAVGEWQDVQGGKHPISLLCVTRRTLARVKSTLRHRRIGLNGSLSLSPPAEAECAVELTPAGTRFHFGKTSESQA
jgi:predicted N-acetyltransferase YhbS